jgi:hypothetical protein
MSRLVRDVDGQPAAVLRCPFQGEATGIAGAAVRAQMVCRFG